MAMRMLWSPASQPTCLKHALYVPQTPRRAIDPRGHWRTVDDFHDCIIEYGPRLKFAGRKVQRSAGTITKAFSPCLSISPQPLSHCRGANVEIASRGRDTPAGKHLSDD